MRILYLIGAFILIMAAGFSAVTAIASCVCYVALGERAMGLTFLVVLGIIANISAMCADDILKKERFYANKK